MILFLVACASTPPEIDDSASDPSEDAGLITEFFPCFEVEADPADLTYLAEVPYPSHSGGGEYVLDDESIELDLKALMLQDDGSYLWLSSRESTYLDWVIAPSHNPDFSSYLYWRGSPEGCTLTVYQLQ